MSETAATYERSASDDEAAEFRLIDGFPDYEINRAGTIRRTTTYRKAVRGMVLKPYRCEDDGYRQVMLHRNNVRRRFFVHVLIALTFIGPSPGPGFEVSHEDGNSDHNHASNLKWRTKSENCRLKRVHGRGEHGSRNGLAKLTEADIPTIRQRLARGDRQLAIASDYGVHKSLISLIKARRVWTHVP